MGRACGRHEPRPSTGFGRRTTAGWAAAGPSAAAGADRRRAGCGAPRRAAAGAREGHGARAAAGSTDEAEVGLPRVVGGAGAIETNGNPRVDVEIADVRVET